jgi:hypothetical protein
MVAQPTSRWSWRSTRGCSVSMSRRWVSRLTGSNSIPTERLLRSQPTIIVTTRQVEIPGVLTDLMFINHGRIVLECSMEVRDATWK